MKELFVKDNKKIRNGITGKQGETLAVLFLENKGYKILARNFKTKFGEIDIIAKDKDVIVFVEVKSRSTLAFGRPIEAINIHKQRKIRQVAEYYLMISNQSYNDCRFDVIEIVDEQIIHEENAF